MAPPIRPAIPGMAANDTSLFIPFGEVGIWLYIQVLFNQEAGASWFLLLKSFGLF